VSLFDAMSSTDLQAARIVTGTTMAAFLAVGLVPSLRAHTGRIRAALLALYLSVCVVFVAWVLLR